MTSNTNKQFEGKLVELEEWQKAYSIDELGIIAEYLNMGFQFEKDPKKAKVQADFFINHNSEIDKASYKRIIQACKTPEERAILNGRTILPTEVKDDKVTVGGSTNAKSNRYSFKFENGEPVAIEPSKSNLDLGEVLEKLSQQQQPLKKWPKPPPLTYDKFDAKGNIKAAVDEYLNKTEFTPEQLRKQISDTLAKLGGARTTPKRTVHPNAPVKPNLEYKETPSTSSHGDAGGYEIPKSQVATKLDDNRVELEKLKLFDHKNALDGIKNNPDQAPRGLRYNTGKTLYNLIPPYPLEQIAKVFTRGAEKYAPNNWKKGMPWSEVEGSLMRHFEAYRSGEDFDDESKLYHMAHVAVNAMFLIDYYRSNPQFDDRLKSYMSKPRIVLDIDEVVCGWAAGYKAWTGKDIQAKYWDSRYGFTSELAELAKNKEFWLSLPCIRHPDFVPHAYVSSRSIPVEWTQEWLEKNGLPCRPVHHVPFDHSKIETLKKIGVDYFVDDRFENFYEAEKAGICSFLMSASHNSHYHVGFKRIDDLKIKNIVR